MKKILIRVTLSLFCLIFFFHSTVEKKKPEMKKEEIQVTFEEGEDLEEN